LRQGVTVRARIAGMFHKCFAGPGFGAFPVVVVGVVFDVEDREFAPADDLIEKSLLRFRRNFGFFGCGFDGMGDGERADVAEVEVRRKPAGSVQFGMVAVLFIVKKSVVDEGAEHFEGGMGSAGEGVDGTDGAVELMEACRDVVVDRVGGYGLGWFKEVARFGVGGRDEECGQHFFKVRAEVMEKKVAAPEDRGRNNDIGVDGPIRKLEAAREHLAPALGLAAGVFVSNDEGGLDFFEEGFERVVGMAAEGETNSALGSVGGNIAEALRHEVVMAQVGVGVIGNDREKNDDRKIEKIAGFNGDVEGGVVEDAHGALHPVDDALGSRAQRAATTNENARIFGELCERFRNGRAIGHEGDPKVLLSDGAERGLVRIAWA